MGKAYRCPGCKSTIEETSGEVLVCSFCGRQYKNPSYRPKPVDVEPTPSAAESGPRGISYPSTPYRDDYVIGMSSSPSDYRASSDDDSISIVTSPIKDEESSRSDYRDVRSDSFKVDSSDDFGVVGSRGSFDGFVDDVEESSVSFDSPRSSYASPVSRNPYGSEPSRDAYGVESKRATYSSTPNPRVTPDSSPKNPYEPTSRFAPASSAPTSRASSPSGTSAPRSASPSGASSSRGFDVGSRSGYEAPSAKRGITPNPGGMSTVRISTGGAKKHAVASRVKSDSSSYDSLNYGELCARLQAKTREMQALAQEIEGLVQAISRKGY